MSGPFCRPVLAFAESLGAFLSEVDKKIKRSEGDRQIAVAAVDGVALLKHDIKPEA